MTATFKIEPEQYQSIVNLHQSESPDISFNQFLLRIGIKNCYFDVAPGTGVYAVIKDFGQWRQLLKRI